MSRMMASMSSIDIPSACRALHFVYPRSPHAEALEDAARRFAATTRTTCMSRFPGEILLLLALAPVVTSAQTMFSVGGSVGIQSYQAAVDDPRVLSSIELL